MNSSGLTDKASKILGAPVVDGFDLRINCAEGEVRINAIDGRRIAGYSKSNGYGMFAGESPGRCEFEEGGKPLRAVSPVQLVAMLGRSSKISEAERSARIRLINDLVEKLSKGETDQRARDVEVPSPNGEGVMQDAADLGGGLAMPIAASNDVKQVSTEALSEHPANQMIYGGDDSGESLEGLVRGRVIWNELDISSGTLQGYRDARKIPYVRLSARCIRYDLPEVRAALAALTVGAIDDSKLN